MSALVPFEGAVAYLSLRVMIMRSVYLDQGTALMYTGPGFGFLRILIGCLPFAGFSHISQRTSPSLSRRRPDY
jgi:hypothetical protein